MADNKIQNISEFFKLLVEWGGVYKVDDDMFIKTVGDGSPVLISINNNPLPLMLFSDNMKTGKHTFFNPLIEPLGHSAERTWFKQSRSLIVGNLIKAMMKQVVELSIKQDNEVDYEQLEAIRPFIKIVDKKLLTEIDKLEPVNILRIIYNKGKRIAQAQTDLLDPEFQESMKFRKGSWEPIIGMLTSFMGVEDIHEVFQHKATIISMQETDAFLNVMLKVSQAINQYVALLLNKDLRVADFEMHMCNLDEYRKACAWAVSGTIQQDREAVKTDTPTSPWKPSAIPTIGPTFLPQSIPFVAAAPVISSGPSVPNSDPMLFARMAQQIANNPFIDANQLTPIMAQNPYEHLAQNPYNGMLPMGGMVVPDNNFALRGSVTGLMPPTKEDSEQYRLPKPRSL